MIAPMNERESGPSAGGAGSRWAADPERVDPDDFSAQQPFAKLMTWAPCPICLLQVHTSLTRYLLQGIACPSCGTQLLAPPPEGSEQMARALRMEDRFSEQLYSDAH
jgi:hypothetical protein